MGSKAYETDDIKQAVSASATLGLIKGIALDVTGYGRARFIFSLNNGTATTASMSAGGGVWQATSSGATFAEVSGTSMAAITSGVISGATPIVEIDVPIAPGFPALQLSSFSVLSTGINHSVIVQLYKGIDRPDSTDSVQETVTV